MEKLTKEQRDISKEIAPVKIPILKIRMMSDEEWNKLAYKNYLERNEVVAL